MEPFKKFATQRVVFGVLLTVAVLWLTGTVLGLFNKTEAPVAVNPHDQSAAVKLPAPAKTGHSTSAAVSEQASHTAPSSEASSHASAKPAAEPAAHSEAAKPAESVETIQPRQTVPLHQAEKTAAASPHGTESSRGTGAKRIPGVIFVTATIKPLSYELHERFWGWRPNDILNVTDNVNNFQLGVLEVTRRTTVTLTERLSRTGSVEALNKNLERAMDWLMTSPERYWFPSPESRYDDALAEMATYRGNLEKGAAAFYTRADNLLPLLTAYDNLLGSCDENLTKTNEANGEPVSWFRVDDYFYYAKGVASAMGTILEAVLEDFQPMLESRHGTEILHHAIASCQRASQIDPWLFVTDSDYSGIFANHRANMAAPISHARFYIEVLIAVLST